MFASPFSSCLATIKENHLERCHLFPAAAKPCVHLFPARPRAQKSAHWSPRALLYQIRIVQHATAIKLSALPIKPSAGAAAAACPRARRAPSRPGDARSPGGGPKLTRRSSAGPGGRGLALIHGGVRGSLGRHKTRWQRRAGARPLPGASIELNHLVWQTLNA